MKSVDAIKMQNSLIEKAIITFLLASFGIISYTFIHIEKIGILEMFFTILGFLICFSVVGWLYSLFDKNIKKLNKETK